MVKKHGDISTQFVLAIVMSPLLTIHILNNYRMFQKLRTKKVYSSHACTGNLSIKEHEQDKAMAAIVKENLQNTTITMCLIEASINTKLNIEQKHVNNANY